MNEHFIQIMVLIVGLVSGLIATYVSLQNRALLAEVRKELAEMEGRIFEKVNGKYVRAQECKLRESHVHEKLEELSAELRAWTRRGES